MLEAAPVTNRQLKYFQAVNEAIDQSMAADPRVFLLGLGIPDPVGIFGTTKGLQEKYGPRRVFDMPISENGMTGVALGAALVGMRPLMTHMRLEFAIPAMDQICNQAAKWHYMFGGQSRVPMVMRMIVGRGWGQGPQHSQSLHAWFAHIPGLKVVMPATAYDAKGLLISAIEDDNPVVFIEHRWLYGLSGPVPQEPYRVPLGQPARLRSGKDVTIVGSSYASLDAVRAADRLAADGIDAEVIDLRTIAPLDDTMILESVAKTGRLVVCDQGSATAGFSAEIVARVTEKAFAHLKSPPQRVALPDLPTPTSRALSNYFYPTIGHVVVAVRRSLGLKTEDPFAVVQPADLLDVPDNSFTGPF